MSNYNPYTPTPRIISSSRYLPKLTTITETPLSKHRLAALTRINSPKSKYSHHTSSTYVPPRPRRIDTSDIDVSAQRYANRRISENKLLEETAEPAKELQKEESLDDIPAKGRTTIRRDRALVRLRTVRMRSRSKSPSPKIEEKAEPKPELKLEPKVDEKTVDIDPGYGSSERSSSGSWRNNFEGELDLYDKKVTSPTAKTPGENFFEKYHITDVDSINTHYLTMNDVPAERRDSVRRRNTGKLPSFKEICSDISSDKLTDDLNAGELRRRASLIIEDEINKIRQSESGTMLCLLEQQVADIEDNESDKRKSRKVKKLRQKITAKTSIENPEPKTQIKAVISVEIEEKEFNPCKLGVTEDTNEVSNKTFKLPLRKKKKLTDVDAKITCDPIVSPTALIDSAPTVTPKENVVGEAVCAEIKTNEKDDRKTHEAVVNIKTKSADLDSKLLLDKDEVNEAPGEQKKIKKIVKTKPQEKTEVEAAPTKMNPLRKDISADDFWGMLNSRETAVFSKRKQQVIEEKKKNIFGWAEVDDSAPATSDVSERKSVLKTKAIPLDKTKISESEAPKKIEPPGLKEQVKTAKITETDSADKGKISTQKSNSGKKLDSVLKKSEKDVSGIAEKIASIKLSEPKVDQKREESTAKTNKLEKSTADAPKADNVSDAKLEEKPSGNKKINEKVSPKQTATEIKEEAPLKLQPVPKPSNLNLATIIDSIELPEGKVSSPKSPPKSQKKFEEKLPESPKSPPWKLQKKVDEKLPESPKTPPWKLQKKVEEKLSETPKSPPWKFQKKVEVVPSEGFLQKQESPSIEAKEESKIVSSDLPTTKMSNKAKDIAKDRIPDTKQQPLITTTKTQAIKTSDQKLSPDEIKLEISIKSHVTDQIPNATFDSLKVNEQAGVASMKKKKASEISEGQNLETKEAKVLNETKNTQAELNTDEPKLVNNNSKKSLGKLSKFPTLNNLNSISVNDAIVDNQQQHTDQSNICDTIENKTIETIAKDSQVSIASEFIKASSPPATETANKEESESESESSSYEDDSEESSDEMEKKKDFNPQKKVKLDFTQMRKCYGGKDEKPLITLVARPRPLWKIKRNRHAVFSESETESSAEEETRSTAGDSAGSSQSSTHSEKLKKKNKGKGENENITALMSELSVQDDKNGEENTESEAKKKNRLSISSQDSGFCGIGATAAKSPRKAMGEF